MIYAFIVTLFTLLIGHAIADYPLQGPYLSSGKNPNLPEGANGMWRFHLFYHGLIHGGFVWFFTKSLGLGAIEVVAHIAIDHQKTRGRISAKTDQLLHIACKVFYAGLVASATHA